MEAICITCKKEFLKTHGHQKYCSKECYPSNIKLKNESTAKKRKTCKICNKTFLTAYPKQNICSKECRKKDSTFKHVCQTCGKEYVNSSKNSKFCSPSCLKIKNICQICGKGFFAKTASAKYCSEECKNTYLKTLKHVCITCGKEYISVNKNSKFCSQKCFRFKNTCSVCDKKFISKTSVSKYCSEECAKTINYNHNKNKTRKTNFTNFGDLLFWYEKEFVDWFKKNYVLFGLKRIIKIDDNFPDVLAEIHDGRKLRIELEFKDGHFKTHKHDPNMCDLIVCFIKKKNRTNIQGVPIIAIFDSFSCNDGSNNFNIKDLELTKCFKSIVLHCQKQLKGYLAN